MTDTVSGFVVHASWDSGKGATRVFLVGRLENGDSFAVVFPNVRPGFYLRESDERAARDLLPHAQIAPSALRTMDGEHVRFVAFARVHQMQRGADALSRSRIRTYEADLRVCDRLLMDRGVFGSIRITGRFEPGRHVDRVYIEPDIGPCDRTPKLSICSIDIENDPDTRRILSIAVATDDPFSAQPAGEVLFSGRGPDLPYVTAFVDEKDLLEGFRRRIIELDPDIVTGWNVIEYDFKLLAERMALHGVEFSLGRSDRSGTYISGDGAQSSSVIIPGRQVVDAMRVIRSSERRFFDNRLDTVAREVLGEGKAPIRGESRVQAIMSAYRSDSAGFCAYNLRDAQLVLDILHATGMLELTVRRAMLTGMPLSRAWTSVSAFERIYIERLHRRGIVAPTHGVDVRRLGRAPGGAIIPPQPGLFDNVLVFDFKSLYPSIMRTFNIDPLAYLPPERLDAIEDVIEAPNGASFRRDVAILPGILAEFFRRREQAKARNDASASYVYKIIMNSFYGVLGTGGCRFAAADIAGAITGFGHEFLSWCREHFESRGYQVLYGDTDSLFVRHVSGPPDPDELLRTGAEAAKDATGLLSRHIEKRWKVRSYLELEFECLYRRFFLPALRGASGGLREVDVAALHGRAKGYAGLRYDPEHRGATPLVDVKGMEAVRRDWTEAAKQLQREMLGMVFEDATAEAIEKHVRDRIEKLRAGMMDDRLVYHKALRKPVDSYSRNRPPHVRAAMLLPPDNRRGVIAYLWTTEGPEPPGRLTHPIDYEHYVEKQIRPVVESIGDVIGHRFSAVFDSNPQRELF